MCIFRLKEGGLPSCHKFYALINGIYKKARSGGTPLAEMDFRLMKIDSTPITQKPKKQRYEILSV